MLIKQIKIILIEYWSYKNRYWNTFIYILVICTAYVWWIELKNLVKCYFTVYVSLSIM